MSETELDIQLSRRQFLAGCAGCAAAASAPAATATAPQTPASVFPSPIESLGDPGGMSPHGQKLIDDFDREFAQQRGPPAKTINVVEEWGLDPSGNTPINGMFEAEVSGLSNVRIVFPGDGTFALDGPLTFSPDGPIDIIGNGATFVVPPNTQYRAIKGVGLPSGTLIQGFTVDATADGAWANVFVETDGIISVRDVTVSGYFPPLPDGEINEDFTSVITPSASSESSKIQVRNFRAVGGTAADLHSDSDSSDTIEETHGTPIGLWVGQNALGTVQMVNCKLRGWNNGTYSGRTMARVEILDGIYWNNTNCQVRISGDSVVDGATLLLDDRRWSMKKNPGPYSLGEHQGVYAARIDPGGNKGNQRDPAVFRNVRVKGLSMGTLSGLLDWEGSAGPGLIENCEIINHIDVPAILGEAPGSQGSYGAAPQTNIMMEWSLVTGSTTKVAEVNDRPQSRIQKTCISVPGAGPEGIDGMEIGQGVGFGKQCKYGLKNPKKVGDGNPPGQLPIPDNPGGPGGSSGLDNSGKEGPSKGVFVAVIDGIFMLLFIFFGIIVLFIAGIVGALGALAGMLGGD